MAEHLDLFFTLFGLLFAVFGVVSWRRTRRLRSEGVRVPGVVERVHWQRSEAGSSSGSGSWLGYPVVHFVTADGQEMHVESEVGSRPCPVRDGQPVTVVYLPDDPTQARPEQLLRTGTWAGVLFTFGGALVAVAGAAVTVLRARG
jgi:hypothetical protein